MPLSFSTITKPLNNQVVDPSTGLMREEWIRYFQTLTTQLNGAVGEISGGGAAAPVGAEYIVGSADATLTAERVLTNSTSITWDQATPAQVEARRAALTGDVTASANDNATTITSDAVTNAKLANMAQGLIKGRAAAAGTGDPQDLTSAQATAILDTFTSGAKGLVPASGGGTTTFLRADGSFATPTGGGITSVVMRTFTASTTYTPTAGMAYCWARNQAPGGGGGGADSVGGSTLAAGGGGGGGEYAEGRFTAADIGASQSITIGAAGTAGSNTGGNGGTGGTTSIGSLLTCVGGTGGTGTGSASGSEAARAGGAGGTGGTGGSFRVPGGVGAPGRTLRDSTAALVAVEGGRGGDAVLGRGGGVQITADAAGIAGTNYGGGGGGATEDDATGQTGGVAGAGIITILEFIA